jgi:hypothetical protein
MSLTFIKKFQDRIGLENDPADHSPEGITARVLLREK